MRYTECRRTQIAGEVLSDLATRTGRVSSNYDGSREEPVVLPSKIPNLLLNGATGIAVGMATNIPPHNLKELCRALLKLLKDPETKPYQLVANDAVHGPDFPTRSSHQHKRRSSERFIELVKARSKFEEPVNSLVAIRRQAAFYKSIRSPMPSTKQF